MEGARGTDLALLCAQGILPFNYFWETRVDWTPKACSRVTCKICEGRCHSS